MATKTKELYFDNKKLWIDTLILILWIFLTTIFFIKHDLSETLYSFAKKHEYLQLDELVTVLAISSIYMLFFMLKRFIELQKIIKTSNTDPLIGITNRRKGMEYIVNEIDNLKTLNYNSSLIMYDIDNFKNINDVYGHDVGDYVLTEITSIVEKEIRNADVPIRWGGEEFIIICPNTDLVNASILAERCRSSIERFVFKNDIKITASFGVIELIKNEEFKKQIIRVDNFLYKSKKSGKNQISF